MVIVIGASQLSCQEGLHTFTWSYVKDGRGATDVPEDCAWIDYISFPPVMVENNGIAVI